MRELTAIVREVERASGERSEIERILRRHPKGGRGFFSNSELIRGFRYLKRQGLAVDEQSLVRKLRMKPVRTRSGVAPLTVLTKPFPCPGRCIFCPSDVRMPKSYLSDEPGAQRAAEHQFDPYDQTFSRLRSFHHTGHRIDKIELIILGGTWSYYPVSYQRWFVKRCFDAMNDFAAAGDEPELPEHQPAIDFRRLDERVDGLNLDRRYNRVVADYVRLNGGRELAARECASWSELERAHRVNEDAAVRCVGLVVETRPDRIDEAEVERIRRLGATKVQIGFQSLDDRVLALNRRGHDSAATRRAMHLLRAAGFKIHAHWMANLHGSDVERDLADFERIFSDAELRPDELKIYPCSLIESAELMSYWRDGRWRPYDTDELRELLVQCMARTPEYCRLTRVIRDIPGTDIVTGNKVTNLRQEAEQEACTRGLNLNDIRFREVRSTPVDPDSLALARLAYEAGSGEELFLQFVTAERVLAGFLRLRLPTRRSFIDELSRAAIVREVHVYGEVVGLGEDRGRRAQHAGLGKRLIEAAAELACERGYERLAVISSIGTRRYYRNLGFEDGELYQHLRLPAASAGGAP